MWIFVENIPKMNTKTKAWIHAFRLRTLALALSSTLAGALLSGKSNFNTSVFVMALFTTLFLQILSNLANDYGDFQHGADSDGRVGPKRAVQSGEILPGEMLRMIIVFVVFSLISGILLLYFALGAEKLLFALLFFLLGVASIAAAVKYTAGKNPYGYKGFGDLFVFIFFGLVGVMGTHFLMQNIWDYTILFPAITIGLMSTGVLNLNNMRDIENDAKVSKITIPVMIGSAKAKRYHFSMIVASYFSALVYFFIHFNHYGQFVAFITLPLFVRHLWVVFKNVEPRLLDPELKIQAISTLFFSLSFGLAFFIFS